MYICFDPLRLCLMRVCSSAWIHIFVMLQGDLTCVTVLFSKPNHLGILARNLPESPHYPNPLGILARNSG